MRKEEQEADKTRKKKHIASENMSCVYFTLLVQHELAGGLADRCAEETGEESQNRLLSRVAKKTHSLRKRVMWLFHVTRPE